MRITNKHGLPESLVRAAENNPYSRGECDFTVTQLLKPPQMTALEEKHKDELEEDVSGRIWALLGSGVHKVLEVSARPGIDIVEKRYFAKFGKFTVSGQIDLYEGDTKTLSDYKVTKSYAFHKKAGSGQKLEWIIQTNAQRELALRNGIDVEKLQIVGILRDYDEKKVDEPGYPQSLIMKVNIPIWEREKISSYIEERCSLHSVAKYAKYRDCTKEETWYGRRCAQYCSVSKYCSQHKITKTTGLL